MFTCYGCSPAEETNQNAQIDSTSVSFDEIAHGSELTVANSEPTIEELQEELSAVANTSYFTGIGGYILGVDDTRALNDALSYCTDHGYGVGVLMLDIKTGYGVAYNVDEEFYSASSVKGLYVACIAESSPEAVELRGDSIYSTLAHSSEEHYFALRDTYLHEPLVEWCKEAGVDEEIGYEWFPVVSSKTLAKLWLRNYEYFSSGSEEIEALLPYYENTYKSPLAANLSGRYRVCSKAGWIGDDGYSSAVDAGVVYASTVDEEGELVESPYLVVIMCDAPGDTSMLDALVVTLDDIHQRM